MFIGTKKIIRKTDVLLETGLRYQPPLPGPKKSSYNGGAAPFPLRLASVCVNALIKTTKRSMEKEQK